jgi:hypothetical protein
MKLLREFLKNRGCGLRIQHAIRAALIARSASMLMREVECQPRKK